MVEHLGDEQAVLVLDETGFLKKGDKPVGCSASTPGGGPLVGLTAGLDPVGDASRIAKSGCFRLRQPAWAGAARPSAFLPQVGRRCAAPRCCRVPERVGFATKPRLGRALLAPPLPPACGAPGSPQTVCMVPIMGCAGYRAARARLCLAVDQRAAACPEAGGRLARRRAGPGLARPVRR